MADEASCFRINITYMADSYMPFIMSDSASIDVDWNTSLNSVDYKT